MPTSISLLLLLFLTCAPHPLSSTPTTHNRRTLHQPFFPQDSIPPSQPPNTTPKLPFSTTPTTTTPSPSSDQQPFFPSFPSPPPPPLPSSHPSPFASFPANISSLSLPTPPKSKPVSSKLIATAIAAVLAAAVILFAVVFLHLRKKKQHSITTTTTTDQKSHHRSSDSNNSSGVHKPRPPRRASQTSSEFLYLGTLVNSHNTGNIDSQTQGSSNLGRDISNVSNVINPRKLDSPELRPLPPLSGQIFQHNHENAEVGSSREEFSEEFFSPRGSLGGRESSIGAGSASRRAFADVAVENFETRRMMGSGSGSGSSSFSDSSSGSGNRARSVSLSVSPPVSLSPISSRPKSPELIAIQTAAAPPSRPPPPPPMPPRLTTFAPSPPNLSSPERDLSSGSSSPAGDSRRSHESSPGLSIFYPRNFSNSGSIPAPPPPPPPPPLPPVAVHLESPTTPALAIRQAMVKPPALVAPSRPVAIQSGTPLVSPMELPEVSEGIERNEDTPKPRLKPLHWDKVRASSDREMVWDQLKSSSFK